MQAWILEKLQQLADFGRTRALPAAIVLLAGIVIAKVLMQLIKSLLGKTKLDKSVSNLMLSVIRVLLYVSLALIVLATLGVDITGVVALASVLTLAISLSVQNTLTNVIGGFTLLTTKPFSAGDFVEIAAQSGTVQEVGLAYTKLCTGDNKTISIPNNAVVSAEIVNYTVAGTRRVDVLISVPYDAPVDQVLAALRQAAQVPTAMNAPAPFAAVKNYDGGTINCLLQVWSKSEHYWTTLFEVNKNVKQIFDAQGLCLTCPHIYVHTDK